VQRTVTQDLINVIIANWPEVPSYLIHSAGRQYCLSGAKRLRDLKKKGLIYTYKNHRYYFNDSPPLFIHGLLKGL
jgi:hypothetical protein